jgi:beta-aspartyl-dipeptidase (metallo-type)
MTDSASPMTTLPTMTLLRNAHVFAPADLGVQDVLLAGGQIVALAPKLALPPQSWPLDVVDLQGLALIPGLVDGHVHFAGGGGEAGASTRVPPVQLTHLTRAGVTSAIGLLGTDGTTRSIAELLACARGLQDGGVSTWCYTGSYQLPLVTLSGSVRSDLVHNDRLIAVGEVALSDHRSSQPTYDELLRIASDCHVCGMMTGKAGVLHLHMGDGRRGLELVRKALHDTELPARTFHPTHVNRQRWLWQEAKDLTRTTGAYVDVTAFEADADSLDAAEAIGDWLDSGLPTARLTVSSDGGGCLPVFDRDGVLQHMDVGQSMCLSDAIATLLAAGRSLADILPPFTCNPAQLFRLSGKGTIAVGAAADVVVLTPAGRTLHVWGSGRCLVRDGQPLVRGRFESAQVNS